MEEYKNIEGGSTNTIVIAVIVFLVLIVLTIIGIYITDPTFFGLLDEHEKSSSTKKETKNTPPADDASKSSNTPPVDDASKSSNTPPADDATKSPSTTELAKPAKRTDNIIKTGESTQNNIDSSKQTLQEVTKNETVVINNPSLVMLELVGVIGKQLNIAEIAIYNNDGINIANKATVFISGNNNSRVYPVTNIYDETPNEVLTGGSSVPKISLTFNPAVVVSQIVITAGTFDPNYINGVTLNLYSAVGILYKTQVLNNSLIQTITFSTPSKQLASVKTTPIITSIQISAASVGILTLAEIEIYDDSGFNISNKASIRVDDTTQTDFNDLVDGNYFTYVNTLGTKKANINLIFPTPIQITSILIRNRASQTNNTLMGSTMNLLNSGSIISSFMLNNDLEQKFVFGVVATIKPEEAKISRSLGLPSVKVIELVGNRYTNLIIERIRAYDENNNLVSTDKDASAEILPSSVYSNMPASIILSKPGDTDSGSDDGKFVQTLAPVYSTNIPAKIRLIFNTPKIISKIVILNSKNIQKVNTIDNPLNSLIGAQLNVYNDDGITLYNQYILSNQYSQMFLYNATIPFPFSNSRIRIYGTNLYLSWSDTASGNIEFAPLDIFDMSGKQTFTISIKDSKLSIDFLDSSFGTGKKYLKWNSAPSEKDNYSRYSCFLGSSDTDAVWHSDGKNLYNTSFNSLTNQSFRLAAVKSIDNKYILKCVPPSDNISLPLILESNGNVTPSYTRNKGILYPTAFPNSKCPDGTPETIFGCMMPKPQAIALCTTDNNCIGYGQNIRDTAWMSVNSNNYRLYGSKTNPNTAATSWDSYIKN